ncbi:glycine C-acetyltransferase [Pelagibacterium flavum]|uniref:2-amino-3-ketobutyrate coenzyme A ligase n=1 Tax=Pelagibacterium flavum TaxID=2984530 RepID=A0ABY6ILJ7_9HYPH|nr:glycine C-acetyltransferase [Pelagibacterium sp. YIM 151497]UYQ71453.1 glycine C-acetyltransferase [Pelagibacterium sp. YIM 151497]
MMDGFAQHLSQTLDGIRNEGLFKSEMVIGSAQQGEVTVGGRTMVNLCANNYLGLANDPEVVEASAKALEKYGSGMASVRFICGTHELHKELEQTVARYLEKDDAILFGSCFDANGGIFETLLGPEDAVISDTLNHASIIDGVRLSKARRYRFHTSDMDDLRLQLQAAEDDGARFKLIVTDGVFSMDGYIARLPEICDLAEDYKAAVLIDECHATGHLGEKGRGTPALTGAGNRVDIISGTFGKTLGGAMGGFIAGPQPVVDLLRQRARPYLFSNALPPSVAAGAIKAIEIAEKADDRRATLDRHTKRFRSALADAGFDLLPGETPIIPVMLHDAVKAQSMAKALQDKGVLVSAFSFPVVPKGKARIRTQMSAGLSDDNISFAIDAFISAGKDLGAI